MLVAPVYAAVLCPGWRNQAMGCAPMNDYTETTNISNTSSSQHLHLSALLERTGRFLPPIIAINR